MSAGGGNRKVWRDTPWVVSNQPGRLFVDERPTTADIMTAAELCLHVGQPELANRIMTLTEHTTLPSVVRKALDEERALLLERLARSDGDSVVGDQG